MELVVHGAREFRSVKEPPLPCSCCEYDCSRIVVESDVTLGKILSVIALLIISFLSLATKYIPMYRVHPKRYPKQ